MNSDQSIIIVRLKRIYLVSVAVILYLTAFGKLISVMGESPFLKERDILMPFLNNRVLLIATAVLEVLVASIVLFSRNATRGLLFILWLCSLFLTYRVAQWYGHYAGYCKCLGFPFDGLGFSSATINKAALALLAYMLLGCLAFSLMDLRRKTWFRAFLRRAAAFNNNRMITCLIAAFGLYASGQLCEARQYHVDGEIEISHFRQRQLQWTKHREFEVFVDGCKYTLIMYISNRANYVINTYDGTNTYALTVMPVTNSVTGKKQSHPLLIDREPYVRPSGAYSEYVWLAFASHCYLNQMTNGTLNPLWPIEDHTLHPTNVYLKAVVSRFNDGHGLPSKMTYLADGLFRYYDSTANTSRVIPLPFPYEKGYIKALYEATSTITNLTTILPSAFSFTLFSTPLSSNAQIHPYLVVNGHVKEYHEGPFSIMPPTLSNATLHVVDTRMKGVIIKSIKEPIITYPYVNYIVESNRWPDAKDLQIARLRMENLMLRAAIIPKKKQEPQYIYMAVTILLLILPLISYIYTRSINRKHHTINMNGKNYEPT